MNIIKSIDNGWLLAWNRFVVSSNFLSMKVKFIAEFLIYSVPVILIVLWFYPGQAKKVALRGLLAAGLGLGINKIIGPIINRPRPFEGQGIKELLFHRPDYSFPSDHATLLFALTFSFWFSGYKKLAIFMLILSILISSARIAAGIHFPTDIIGGMVLGFLVALHIKLLDRYLDSFYNLLINLAKKVRLA